jgi:hypothetical protein
VCCTLGLGFGGRAGREDGISTLEFVLKDWMFECEGACEFVY